MTDLLPVEAVDAALADALRRVMRGVAATVVVVTTEDDGEVYGMTATSFTSLCLEPPSVLIAVNRQATMHDRLLARGLFAVNVLPEGFESLARLFGDAAVDNDERFRHGTWRRHPQGPPLLEEAQAWLLCAVGERLVVGTHTLVVGRVLEAELVERIAPLVHVDGRYIHLPTR
jgi:flavin reductase (DIM6/NTAB) family NADH-FMN oxidoreductase RutF